MQASVSEPVKAPEAKPVLINRGAKKAQENGKAAKKNTRNNIGRIIPGDDSGSDEEEDGEGIVDEFVVIFGFCRSNLIVKGDCY